MNKKELIIFGNNSFAQLLLEYVLKYTDFNVVAFTVNKEFINNDKISNLPVIPFEKIENLYDPSRYSFLIALGHKNMNVLRENIFNDIVKKGYSIESFIHPTVNLNYSKIGIGNIFLENVFVGPHAIIGDGNIFWNGVNVSHDSNIGSFNYISPSCAIAGNVTINNNCFFGTNCTLRDGITVEDKTLVGAGCYLNENASINSVYLPAKATKINKNSFEIL